MKIKTTLAIASLAILLTACGKEEAPKAVAPAQTPAPVAAPAPSAAPAQPTQAEGDTAANGGPRLKQGNWGR